jgi:hypothetical protein
LAGTTQDGGRVEIGQHDGHDFIELLHGTGLHDREFLWAMGFSE